MTIKAYGKTDIEALAGEIHEARKITKSIIDFGVSQRQILHIIYNLALEIENREQLLVLSDITKEFLDVNVIATPVSEETNE